MWTGRLKKWLSIAKGRGSASYALALISKAFTSLSEDIYSCLCAKMLTSPWIMSCSLSWLVAPFNETLFWQSDFKTGLNKLHRSLSHKWWLIPRVCVVKFGLLMVVDKCCVRLQMMHFAYRWKIETFLRTRLKISIFSNVFPRSKNASSKSRVWVLWRETVFSPFGNIA